MTLSQLETLLERATTTQVAVLGDLMLDEWIIGSASRISPEAPVPVVRFHARQTDAHGIFIFRAVINRVDCRMPGGRDFQRPPASVLSGSEVNISINRTCQDA